MFPSLTQFLLAGLGCVVLGGAALVWKARGLWPRVFLLASIGAYAAWAFCLLRLLTATDAAVAASACRALYLIVALGALPAAALATLPHDQGRSLWMSGRGAFLGAVGIIGLALASLASSNLVFAELVRASGRVEIELGVAGRLLIVFVIAVAAYVLTQVECLLRAMSHLPARAPKAVVTMLAVSVVVDVYVSTEALLRGHLGASDLAVASVPLAATLLVAGVLAFRGAYDDVRLPHGRAVVYSSLTFAALGVLMVALGSCSRLTDLLGFNVNYAMFAALLLGGATLAVTLWFSPARKRRVAAFVDENFYVDRHDYRKEWERVAQRVRPTGDRSELVRAIAEVVHAGLGAQVFVGVLSPQAGQYIVHDSTGALVEELSLAIDGDLAMLLRERASTLVFADKDSDLDLVPAFVEHERLFVDLRIAVVVPLLSAGELVGMLFVVEPAGSRAYSPEDLSLMTVLGAALSSTVYGHLLLREVAERRDGEALVKLSAFVLHDLKNCVSVIRGLAEGASRHMADPEFRSDLVTSLGSTTERMTALMNRLAQMRSATGDKTMRIEVLEVDALVRDALAQSGVSSSANVRLDLRSERGVFVSADREQLGQVLINLVRNALDAMPAGGRLVVSAERLRETETVEIAVGDEGCGMTPEFLADSLFRPFSTTKPSGLGIGLYQCKNVVDELGGKIAVESAPGKGTSVTIRLPLEKGAEASCATAS